ncbi:MAG: hypothetical protein KY455_07175 [Euryarchaeota archaeon]|nr:hypothetical protein [Euryarchaeota archaeon]
MRDKLVKGLALVLSVVAVVAALGLPAEAGTEAKAKVKNNEPQVVAVNLLTDDDASQGGAQVDPVAGGLRAFDIEFEAEDRNNHRDIASGGCSVYQPDGSLHEELGAVFRQGDGKRSLWDTSGAIAYHDPPGTWRVVCHATDNQMAQAHAAPQANNTLEAVFEVRTLAAIEITETAVEFTAGSEMEPGTTTAPTSITVTNLGNVQVDIQVAGTDLAGAQATIPVGRAAYSEDDAMTNASALSTTSTTMSSFDLPPGDGSSKPLWFTLSIPSGDEQFIPAGTYAGTVTVTALEDSG